MEKDTELKLLKFMLWFVIVLFAISLAVHIYALNRISEHIQEMQEVWGGNLVRLQR